MAAYLCPNADCTEYEVPKHADFKIHDPVLCGMCWTQCEYDESAVAQTEAPPS